MLVENVLISHIVNPFIVRPDKENYFILRRFYSTIDEG